MNDTLLLEIAAWRLATELMRRHGRRFHFALTHPGGGQYHCLTLIDKKNGRTGYLNRGGSFTVFERNSGDGGSIPGDRIWPALTDGRDPKELVDEMEALLRVKAPEPLPSTTPEVLVYRVVSAFLTHAAFGRVFWQCLNGFIDTSGYGGGINETYFDAFPSAKERLHKRSQDDFFGQASYRFWFLVKDNEPALCFENTGHVHTKKGEVVELMPLYMKERRVWPVVHEVAGHLLP